MHKGRSNLNITTRLKELALHHLFSTLLIILLLLLVRPFVADILNVIDVRADSDDNEEESDNNEEDFEEKDSIQNILVLFRKPGLW
jgi:hypothetical protein